MRTKGLAMVAGLAALGASATLWAAVPEYVISISVDGMGSKYIRDMGAQLPSIQRLMAEGAGTLNARNDNDYTITLPNHTSMVTGRGIVGAVGHNWTVNTDPAPGQTLASNKGAYVASVFDVAHDNGKSTAMWSGKSKFSLFDTSYNATNGALDTTDVNNGRDKIDYAWISASAPASTLGADFRSRMTASHYNFSFVHFQDPDAAGHSYGWGSTNYQTAMKNVDAQIGSILNFVASDPILGGKTAVIVTADHGGLGGDHQDASKPEIYTIPFYVWGAGVKAGGDLYAMNPGARRDPGTGKIAYASVLQPVRNSELGNLSLDLLNLGPIPGSTINYSQNLQVPEPAALSLLAAGGLLLIRIRRA